MLIVLFGTKLTDYLLLVMLRLLIHHALHNFENVVLGAVSCSVTMMTVCFVAMDTGPASLPWRLLQTLVLKNNAQLTGPMFVKLQLHN